MRGSSKFRLRGGGGAGQNVQWVQRPRFVAIGALRVKAMNGLFKYIGNRS